MTRYYGWEYRGTWQLVCSVQGAEACARMLRKLRPLAERRLLALTSGDRPTHLPEGVTAPVNRGGRKAREVQ